MTKPNLEEEQYQDFQVSIDEEKSDSNIDAETELSIVTIIENKGTEKEEQQIVLDFADNNGVDSKSVELEPAETEEITLNYTVPDQYEGSMWAATVCSETECDSVDVYVREEAFFAVKINEEKSDTEVRREKDLVVTAVIDNEGESSSIQDIDLIFDNTIVSSKNITLEGEEEKEVQLSFNVPVSKPLGSYEVSVSSEDSIYSYTVFVLRETKVLNLSINNYDRGEIVVQPQDDEYNNKVVSSSAQSFEIIRGTHIILDVHAAEYNSFSHWVGDISSEQELSDSIDFILDEDRNIEAVFEPKGTTIHINYDGEGGLESHSSGIYQYDRGDVIPIEAEEPDYGWKFVGWKSIVGDRDDEKYVADPEALSTTIEMAENTIYITAVYEKIMYTLEIKTAGQGSVEPYVGEKEHQKGSTVNLTPQPAEGYVFVGWEGANNNEVEDGNIYIDGDKELIAIFDLQTVTLTINSTPGGTTSPEGKIAVQANSQVSIAAISDVGYDFKEWTGSDNINEPQSSSTYIETGEENETILAEFEEGEICIKLEIAGPGNTNPDPGIYCFSPGENIQINAIADEGSEFIGWTGPVIDNDSRTTQIDIKNL